MPKDRILRLRYKNARKLANRTFVTAGGFCRMPGVATAQRFRVLMEGGWRCYICGCKISVSDDGEYRKGTIDHVVPLSRGGRNNKDNRRAACDGCNQRKGNWTYTELMLGFKLQGAT